MDPFNTPAGDPPPGVTPNLVNPIDQYGATIACASAAVFCTIPVVVIKMFTKIRVLKQVQHEDYILIFAELLFLGWLVMLLKDPNHNAHIWDTRLSALPRINRMGNILIDMYSPTMLVTKCAALLQLQRIFVVNPYNRIWWTSQSLLWSTSIFYTVIFFSCVFQCIPRRKIWRPEIPGTCLDMTGIMAASAIGNVLINIGILALPVAALRGSRISKRKKIVVLSVFSISFLTMVASLGRLGVTISLADTDDFTWALEAQALWAVAEFAMMIIAASVPQTPAFVKYCQARFRGSNAAESAEAAGDGPEQAEMAARPSPWGLWHQIDEEMATTQTTGALSTRTQRPYVDPDVPLPPPLVPPKDVREKERSLPKTAEVMCPKAPPPSPVRFHAITWYVEDSDEASGDDELPLPRRNESSSPILERLPPAHMTRYRHRSI